MGAVKRDSERQRERPSEGEREGRSGGRVSGSSQDKEEEEDNEEESEVERAPARRVIPGFYYDEDAEAYFAVPKDGCLISAAAAAKAGSNAPKDKARPQRKRDSGTRQFRISDAGCHARAHTHTDRHMHTTCEGERAAKGGGMSRSGVGGGRMAGRGVCVSRSLYGAVLQRETSGLGGCGGRC